jgi:hypothetical protein
VFHHLPVIVLGRTTSGDQSFGRGEVRAIGLDEDAEDEMQSLDEEETGEPGSVSGRETSSMG